MTRQEQVQKKKKPATEKRARLFDEARKKISQIDVTATKAKSKVIDDLAYQLSKDPDIERDKISKMISDELKGYVTDRFVQETLPPEYKVAYRSKNALKAKSSRTSSAKQTLPELETEQEPEEIWQISPKDYEVEDLPKYDKTMLIKIIMMYREDDRVVKQIARESDKRLRNYEARIKDLEKENAELKRRLAAVEKSSERETN